ncbi:MAG: hypothetical protein A3G91_03840 [Omnitrophica WOR_2 bacterium RIFCSPLOWO2_12_FULL_50_9]|nr:MAG: hypothetical protein A3D87_09200 [Omnitrophica WOR_2 bacterium RIFCSPHIGHO2_02_FULL_50_17]OGX41670.1 MAG: hypothetical protein A3G91_03840 [Omnitrophica WOR_2 bacterium RIFCSPLOWO2_12_FULL_50_9]
MDAPKTILVIDDEIDLLEMIQFQLKSKGFKVIIAQNGKEALEHLKTVKPHLIVLDMNMPEIGGIEFYKKICDRHGKPQYAILVLTARANMEQLFKDLDVEGFMPKPFEIDHLVQKVEAIVQKGGGHAVEEGAPGIRWKRKICLVENDPESFNRLASAFLDAGYIVNSAKGGAAAIDRIAADVPDVVLVKWDLIDMPGDAVIGRLKDMINPSDVVFVLYRVAEDAREAVRKNIGKTGGSLVVVETDNPAQLLDVVEKECRKLNK